MGIEHRAREITGYELKRKLGSGSYGDVWEARTRGGRPVALKFIDRTRGEAEARLEIAALDASLELNHPCLLQTMETWTEPDLVVVAMELADGTLRQRFDWCRENMGLPGIPADELVFYIREAAQALDYLHGRGKLHRDVKPDNILLVNTNAPPAHAKVGDIGLLRDMGDMAATMTTRGTPPYIAPEAWSRSTQPASDQFSLAVTYVELRQGKRPYPSHDLVALLEAIRMFDPDLSGMEGAEREAIKKALHKAPGDRYESCVAMVEALEAALGVRPGDYKPRVKQIELAGRTAAPSPSRPGSTPDAPVGTPREVKTAPPAYEGTIPAGGPTPVTRRQTTSGEYIAPVDTPKASAEPAPRQEVDWKGQPVGPSRPTPPKPTPVKPGQPEKPEKKGGGVPVGMILAVLLGLGVVAGGIWWVVKNMSGDGMGGTVDGGKKDPGKTDPGKTDHGKTDPSKQPDEEEKKYWEDWKNRWAGYESDWAWWEEELKRLDAIPPPPKTWIPKGYEPRGEAVLHDGVQLHLKIGRKLGGREVEFLLMRPKGRWYYVMRDKASNALCDAFDTENPGKIGADWRKGGLNAKGDAGDDEGLPALRVTRPEAASVAGWVGGRLPTADELDFAAGLDDVVARSGPVGGAAAVGRRKEGPARLDDETIKDDSPLGVRGLSGNGREWTKDELKADGKMMAVLRGRSYTAPKPVTYAELREMRTVSHAKPRQDPNVATPYTGFRVVIEVPEK